MNQEELDALADDQRALDQANGLLAYWPASENSPVTEADIEARIQACKNMRGNLQDSTLASAINTANATWASSIKTALETSRDAAQSDIDNLVGTDTEA